MAPRLGPQGPFFFGDMQKRSRCSQALKELCNSPEVLGLTGRCHGDAASQVPGSPLLGPCLTPANRTGVTGASTSVQSPGVLQGLQGAAGAGRSAHTCRDVHPCVLLTSHGAGHRRLGGVISQE